MTRRVAAIVGLLVLLAAIGWFVFVRDGSTDAPSLEEMADDIGADVMLHLHRGHVPGRSGEIMLVPKPHRYLTGKWDLRTLTGGERETFVSHANPWAYLARVPLIFFRPGHVELGRKIDEPVDLADVAPTYAHILGMPTFNADGDRLPEIVDSVPAPRVIVTIVLDGGGWNVLRRWPDAWPNIRELMRAGTTYTNATIGSAPSLTGPIHSNLGTGSYPVTHGVPTNPFLSISDPSTLRVPTVSELWDEQNGNRAIVAMLGFEDPHVGMIGRGAQRQGGDRDIAVFWNRSDHVLESNSEYYEMPDYVPTDISRLRAHERELDRADGAADGTWNGHEFDSSEIRPATPAFAHFMGDVIVDVIDREPFGVDGITDLLWIELKMPDEAGHAFNMESPEEEAVLQEVDTQVERIVDILNSSLGAEGYLLAITADHGQEPFAEVTGGWRINLRELGADIEAELGPVIEKVTTLDLEIDHDAMEEEGVDAIDIVNFVAGYTLGENIPDGAPGADAVPEERLDETLFAGAFPSEFLAGLTDADIKGFGDSIYGNEGNLTRP